MRNRVIIIACYFGRLPNYFQLWLNSCRVNRDFHWLLFTDDETNYSYPDNVQREIYSFGEMSRLVQKKCGFQTALDAPYKICDFKGLYGFIFQEYLGGGNALGTLRFGCHLGRN